MALAQSLFWVYALMFALAVIGLATMFLFPGGRPQQYSYQAQAEDETQAETSKPEPHITTIAHELRNEMTASRRAIEGSMWIKG